MKQAIALLFTLVLVSLSVSNAQFCVPASGATSATSVMGQTSLTSTTLDMFGTVSAISYDTTTDSIFVLSDDKHQIQKYNADTVFSTLGQGATATFPTTTTAVLTASGFNTPEDMVLVGTDCYIADSLNNRIVRLACVSAFGTAFTQYWGVSSATTSTSVLTTPTAVAVSSASVVYVGDSTDRVYAFAASTATFVTTISFSIGDGLAQTDANSFEGINKIFLDSTGTKMFVQETINLRIIRYDTIAAGAQGIVVFGQSSLTALNSSCQNGYIDSNSAFYDATNDVLFSTSLSESRVAAWSGAKSQATSGPLFSYYYGHALVTDCTPPVSASASNFFSPDVPFYNDEIGLLVVDQSYNRILQFECAVTPTPTVTITQTASSSWTATGTWSKTGTWTGTMTTSMIVSGSTTSTMTMSTTMSANAASTATPPIDVMNACPGVAGRICPTWVGNNAYVDYIVSYRAAGSTTYTNVTTTKEEEIINGLNPTTSYEFVVTGVMADGTQVEGTSNPNEVQGSAPGSVLAQAGGGITSCTCKSSSTGAISCTSGNTNLVIFRIALKLECVGKRLGHKFVYRRNWLVYKTSDIKRVLIGPKVKSLCTLWLTPYYKLASGTAYPGTRVSSKFVSNARHV